LKSLKKKNAKKLDFFYFFFYNLYVIALYRNWRGKLKHFEIERNLFLKYFPEDLKYIENQMTKSNPEEFEVKA
jgi:hypothetical protein